MDREDELKKEGWEKRFTIDEPRLSEMANEYRELGFEVLIEPFEAETLQCSNCYKTSTQQYKTIYIRKKK